LTAICVDAASGCDQVSPEHRADAGASGLHHADSPFSQEGEDVRQKGIHEER
jgi:hypothetical protein